MLAVAIAALAFRVGAPQRGGCAGSGTATRIFPAKVFDRAEFSAARSPLRRFLVRESSGRPCSRREAAMNLVRLGYWLVVAVWVFGVPSLNPRVAVYTSHQATRK